MQRVWVGATRKTVVLAWTGLGRRQQRRRAGAPRSQVLETNCSCAINMFQKPDISGDFDSGPSEDAVGLGMELIPHKHARNGPWTSCCSLGLGKENKRLATPRAQSRGTGFAAEESLVRGD